MKFIKVLYFSYSSAGVSLIAHTLLFFQFFAWEGQWIKRVQDMREKELKWLVKGSSSLPTYHPALRYIKLIFVSLLLFFALAIFLERINSVLFGLLWTCAPVLVSIVSFLSYTLAGNALTVSKAFTAIALFNMLSTYFNLHVCTYRVCCSNC